MLAHVSLEGALSQQQSTWRRIRKRKSLLRRRRSLIRIVHARGAIPHEMGPTRCRAMPALTNQLTRPAPRPPGACRRPVLAVCPLLDLVSGRSDGYTRRECRLPPFRLGGWVVSRVSLSGSSLCPLADLGGLVGRTGYTCFSTAGGPEITLGDHICLS